MIQVNATARITAAKASTSKAYKYLSSLGLKVSKGPLRNRDGAIEFEVLDGSQKDVINVITKATGIKMRRSAGYSLWDLTPDRRIELLPRKGALYVWLVDRQ